MPAPEQRLRELDTFRRQRGLSYDEWREVATLFRMLGRDDHAAQAEQEAVRAARERRRPPPAPSPQPTPPATPRPTGDLLPRRSSAYSQDVRSSEQTANTIGPFLGWAPGAFLCVALAEWAWPGLVEAGGPGIWLAAAAGIVPGMALWRLVNTFAGWRHGCTACDGRWCVQGDHPRELDRQQSSWTESVDKAVVDRDGQDTGRTVRTHVHVTRTTVDKEQRLTCVNCGATALHRYQESWTNRSD